jgi:hypothetical protein
MFGTLLLYARGAVVGGTAAASSCSIQTVKRTEAAHTAEAAIGIHIKEVVWYKRQ